MKFKYPICKFEVNTTAFDTCINTMYRSLAYQLILSIDLMQQQNQLLQINVQKNISLNILLFKQTKSCIDNITSDFSIITKIANQSKQKLPLANFPLQY